MRAPSCSQSPRPSRHSAAVLAANSSALSPARVAAWGSIQGWKSSGRSFGKVSSRLPRSPFGSITSAGTPSMAASSSSVTHSPVLPLPVMPTHTAWVVRSRES